jgi:hypothetical protein
MIIHPLARIAKMISVHEHSLSMVENKQIIYKCFVFLAHLLL